MAEVTGFTGKTNYRILIFLSREICKCDYCGSEAEMVITCSLKANGDDSEPSGTDADIKPEAVAEKTKGRGVCSHCGNESEIWLEI